MPVVRSSACRDNLAELQPSGLQRGAQLQEDRET